MTTAVGAFVGAGDGHGSAPVDGTTVVSLAVADVRPLGLNPRRAFDQDRLRELAKSIATHGVIQPIVVRREERGYGIILGERRWRAARLAGLQAIPAIVRVGVTDVEALELAIIENLQRVDLNAIEEAEGYKALSEFAGMTQSGIAAALNRSQALISRTLQLLKLPKPVQEHIRSGKLSGSHGMALLKYDAYPDALNAIADTAVEHSLALVHVEAKLGMWGPAGVIGARLEEAGLAVSIGDAGDPCRSGACPFHARFGELCLNPTEHAMRVQEMNRGSEVAEEAAEARVYASEVPLERCAPRREPPRAQPEPSSRKSVAGRLRESIDKMDGMSHRGAVILALLTLRSCAVVGRYVDGGQFVTDDGVPGPDSALREGLDYLDALATKDAVRLALSSACQEDLTRAAELGLKQSEIATYLLEEDSLPRQRRSPC
jgi:ParB/RepB/Spo0J family partition protein